MRTFRKGREVDIVLDGGGGGGGGRCGMVPGRERGVGGFMRGGGEAGLDGCRRLLDFSHGLGSG